MAKKKNELWPYSVPTANAMAIEMLDGVAQDPAARTLPHEVPGPSVDPEGKPLAENDPRRRPQRFESFVPIVVDDGVAQVLLGANTVNRKDSPRNTEQLSRAIYNDKWMFNGISSTLPCSNTAIMDKQHTLMAVIDAFERGRANGVLVKPIIMVPIIGLHPTTFATIDGGKGRNTKDTLTAAERIEEIDMNEISENVWSHSLRLFAQYANMMEDLDPSHPLYLYNVRAKLSNDRAVELFNMTPELQESLAFCQKIGVPQHSRSLIPMAVLGMAHMIISGVQSPSAANNFIKSLANGTGLDETSPIHHLREQMIRDKSSKKRMEGIELLALCVRTWNHVAFHRTASTSKRIRSFNKDGSFPEPLPMQRRSSLTR